MDTLELTIQILGGVAAAVMVFVIVRGVRAASKQTLEREVGRSTAWLRSTPVLVVASIAAVALFWFLWRPLPIQLSGPVRLVALIAGALLYFAGIALIIWGRLTLAEMYNVSSSTGVQIFKDHRLIKSGPFQYVRHPMYLGNALWAVGAILIYHNWAMILLAASVFGMARRAKKEEQALIETFGDEYREYMRETPGFWPRIKH